MNETHWRECETCFRSHQQDGMRQCADCGAWLHEDCEHECEECFGDATPLENAAASQHTEENR